MLSKAKSILTLIIVLMQLFGSSALAAIPQGLVGSTQSRLVFKRGFDFSRGFDAATVQPIPSLRSTSREDVSRIIPSNMSPTSNGTLVATQIIDHSLSNWFNSESVRHSTFGRTATQIEKSMEGDLSFGGKEPKSIKHSLRFSMRATQTRADIEYTGLTNAQITYFILQEKTDFEIREPMPLLNTQLVYNHIAAKNDRVQMVSLRWKW